MANTQNPNPGRVRLSSRFIKKPSTRDMKKSNISNILGVISVAAIFAGCVEGLDGGITLWNIICLAVAGLCGWGSKKLEGAK
jgi:hypothetical protein